MHSALTITLALVFLLGACTSSPDKRPVAQNYTTDSGQCSKHAWGTPEMSLCLDTVAKATRDAKLAQAEPDGAVGAEPQPQP